MATARKANSVDAKVASFTEAKGKGFADLTVEQKRELVGVLVKKVVLNDGSIVIERRGGDPIVGIIQQEEWVGNRYREAMPVKWWN